jgi:uncharacterized protein (DUF1697 family)
MPATYVALLRGINVGGKNKLPMKDLTAMFTAAGCIGVTSYIQSGNVIFSASKSLAAKVPSLVSAAIEKQFGFQTRVVVRTVEQMRQVAGGNPFLVAGVEERLLSVMFLADSPEAAHVEKLDPLRSHPDSFLVVGDEIFLHTPTGLADTKLTNAYFDSRLKTIGTSRNWRTVLKLLELMES